jgi:hypothetical protein
MIAVSLYNSFRFCVAKDASMEDLFCFASDTDDDDAVEPAPTRASEDDAQAHSTYIDASCPRVDASCPRVDASCQTDDASVDRPEKFGAQVPVVSMHDERQYDEIFCLA